MIKFGCVLVLLVLWIFATMTQVNNKSDGRAVFLWRALFYWVAIGVAYSIGGMN